MVRMVGVAEVSLACFLSLSIWGTASAIRISMMDMTIMSSMRVKPNSRASERKADSSASLHPSEQRPLAGDPGLRNDKQGVLRNDKRKWVVIFVVFMVPLERNRRFGSATNCNSVRFNMRELCGRW